jgi:hypothetical protein
MNKQDCSLSTMARSKLNLSVSGRDSSSLHRWVLLKNSIVRSTTQPAPPAITTASATSGSTLNCRDQPSPTQDDEEADSFLFPDADKLVDNSSSLSADSSEAAWLDSLLESLDDEDTGPVAPEDEDSLSIHIPSPMSSSDDLADSLYYSPAAPCVYSYPYPVPYPPFHPPLIRSYEHEEDDCSDDEDPLRDMLFDTLPYHEQKDVDDLSVPDAIEDDSDDDSDIPPTPMLTDSTGSSISVDPTSVPLPSEEHNHRLQVYIPSQDGLYNSFDLLPFSDHMLPSFARQEC